MSGYVVQKLPIAVLRPTEGVDLTHVRVIADQIRRDDVLRRPVLVERNAMAILDGHHRYHAARALGLGLVPAVMIDYGDPRLSLCSWTERSFTREEVLAAARGGVLLPAKSTRHILAPPIGDCPVPLGELAPVRTAATIP